MDNRIVIFDSLTRKLRSNPEYKFFLFGEEDLLEDYDTEEPLDLLYWIKDIPTIPYVESDMLVMPVIDALETEKKTKELMNEIHFENPNINIFYIRREVVSLAYRIIEGEPRRRTWDFISREKTYEFAGDDFRNQIRERISQLEDL